MKDRLGPGPVTNQNPDRVRMVGVFSAELGGKAPASSGAHVRKLMTEHTAFLEKPLAEKKAVAVRAASPAGAGHAAVVILDTSSLNDARQILAADPAVAAGLLRIDVLQC